MAVNIRVSQGRSFGRDFWPTKSVLRVGSDPACDVSLPNEAIEAHAVTVELRGGRAYLHNKSQKPIYSDGNPIGSGQSGAWADGGELSFGPHLALQIQLNADTASFGMGADSDSAPPPVESEITASGLDFREIARAKPESTGPNFKTIAQILVIIACVVGFVLLLVFKDQIRGAPTEDPLERREKIVKILSQWKTEPQQQSLVISVQRAYAAQRQGDFETGLLWYDKALDELRRRRRERSSSKSPSKKPTTKEQRSEDDLYRLLLLEKSELAQEAPAY